MRSHRLPGQVERDGLLQHVITKQLIHTAQRLRRLRTVQQHLGVLTINAQARTETVGKHRILICKRDAVARRLELLLKLALIQRVHQVRHERIHIYLVREDAIKRSYLGLGVLACVETKNCHQRIRLAWAVIRHCNHRRGCTFAQVLAADLTSGGVLAPAPRATNVRHPATALVAHGVLLRRRVVTDLGLRNQDGRKRVDQGGLTRARRTRDQKTLLPHRNVKVAVERSPVHKLNSCQLELFGHCSSPSGSLPALAPASRRYSSRSAYTVSASKMWRRTGETT